MQRRCDGFTLLEMITVVAILSLLVGLAFPIAEHFLRSKMQAESREEMRLLADAITSFYGDVESFPEGLHDLVENDPPIDGWMGPYLELDFADAHETDNDYRFDAWRTPYRFEEVSATVRRLTSFGENHEDEGGDGDDLVLDIDVGFVLRDLTRRELDIVNTAILAYNADFLFTNPLSTDYPTLLGQLQAAGYLPPDPESTLKYLADAWGQNYVTQGTNPVVEVLSPGAP